VITTETAQARQENPHRFIRGECQGEGNPHGERDSGHAVDEAEAELDRQTTRY